MQAPNVLMLVTDNQSPDSLGCYGNTEHETPHIDRLAREGTRFLRAFCTSGLCSPSRASILTGLMPSQHGVHLAMPDDEVVPKEAGYDTTREFRSIPQTLREAGYATAMVGKWHLGNHRTPGNGFEHWVALSKGHTTDFHDNQVWVGDDNVAAGGHYEHVEGQHIVEHFSDRAIDYISRRDTDRPFFLQVNYDGPYVLPPTVVGADERNPFFERFANTDFKAFPPLDERLVASVQMPFDFELDPGEEYTLESVFNNLWWTVRCHNDQATRANIAAQNALVDHAIGRVVDHLESEGLTEDTLVIMTTDQSNPYGQRGLWGHPPWTDPPFVHDVTMNVPLIFRRPGTLPAMRVNDRVVSHVDLLATILDHVGLGQIEVANSPGESLEPMLHDDSANWVDAAFFEAESARSIRTPEWLCTEHFEDSGPTELYDLVADPEQWNNVAAEPAYAHVLIELGERLTAFFEQHCDPRYDLWNGGTGQAMVSRYLLFKQRWGDEWEPTMAVGPRFAG